MGNRKIRAAILIAIIVCQPFSAAAQTQDEKTAKIREQLVMIPLGTTIEVRLLKEGSKKFTGILVSISEESFEIRRDKVSSILDETIRFAEVKSVNKGVDLMSVNKRRGTKKTLLTVGFVIIGVAVIAFEGYAQICQNGKCH